jgi:dephospho-CoA kinase
MGIRVIGLTGGIASGKSTVARMLAELGASVVDADQVAREVVRPGRPALSAIVVAFGAEILTPAGEVDRKRLAQRVFADPDARRQLEGITHPRIREEAARRMAELEASGVPVVVYEASLLVESGSHRDLAGLIVVAAPEEVQLRRMQERDGLPADEAGRRLAAQASLRDKLAVADYVIDGSAALETTRAQVAAVWSDIQAGGPRRRG